MKQFSRGEKRTGDEVEDPPEPVFTLHGCLLLGQLLAGSVGLLWVAAELLTEKEDLPARVVVVLFGLFWIAVVLLVIYVRYARVRAYRKATNRRLKAEDT
ncbi:MAG: hypothetical protein C0501_26685 [Isosphaera sp.]|nr:hypothetical protein [Isosphaera sp.]